MSRKKQSYRYIGGIVAATTVITQFQPVIASADISTSDFNMRDNVVSLTGIMEVSNNMGQVTRGDFTGDVTSSRMSKFQFLELNENINRGQMRQQ